MTEIKSDSGSFESMGISDSLLKVLKSMNIVHPTPIQKQSIPLGLKGVDVLGIAQTGTGKTLSFGIPLLEQLSKNRGRALILLPTRELAEQVSASLQPLCRAVNMRSVVLIGGAPMHAQIRDLRQNPRIMMATPGRLVDLLSQGYARLNDVNFLVLDEADRMFDMGFAPQILEIIKMLPEKRQTLLFSATMPANIVKLAQKNMQNPIRVEVSPAGTAAEKIEHSAYIVKREQKISLIKKIAEEHQGTVIIFTRTKYTAEKLNKSLRLMGLKSTEIHSNRSQAQRREALDGFKSGRFNILIATDIAARGIDVADVATVVNFDLPEQAEDYVHRIGRTGRAGRSGEAISFVSPDQRGLLKAIERLMKKNLKMLELPELKFVPAERHADSREREPRSGRNFHPRERQERKFAPAAHAKRRSPADGPTDKKHGPRTTFRGKPKLGRSDAHHK